MRALKIFGVVILGYLVFVVLVESTLAFFQPEDADTFVITTTDEDGISTDRVLVRNISQGQLYASVNHWPRYNRKLWIEGMKVAAYPFV